MLPDGARFMDCGTGQGWTGVAITVLHLPAIPHLIRNDIHGKCSVLDSTPFGRLLSEFRP
jgi:hypothetical protein